MTTKEKEAILKLIKVYKGMPFLWNKNHKDYTNRDRRSEGHRVLLEIYKNVETNATVQTLGKKIQNLRTNFKKERNKEPVMWTKQKQVLLSVINLYRDMTYLWQKDHKDYMNRNRRDEGFSKLIRLYRSYDEHASVKVLKKRIENMRTNYFKELKKVLAAEQAGEEAYVPTLWYYEPMSFLADRADSCHNVTDSDPLQNVETSLDCDDESISSASSKRIKLERQDHTRTQSVHTRTPPSRPEECVAATLPRTRRDDRWEAYGKTIGYQVKDLSGHQLVICQKLISDAIFYAKLNKLNENSHVANPDESGVSAEDGAAYIHIHNDAF